MNELQEELLKIAKGYIKVCEILKLNYYAVSGTLLGAARHKGFIPWDDDMDFVMPRKDYDIFIKRGQKYLDSNLFIQTNETDRNYFHPFCKVRDSNTTMIEESTSNIKMNHGCWIDIFPLDGLPISEKKKKKYRYVTNLYFSFLISYMSNKKLGYGRLMDYIFLLCRKVYFCRKLLYLYRIHYVSKFKFEKCDYLWANWISHDTFIFKKEWLGSCLYLQFEDQLIRVPECYDKLLCSQYGDWKKLPPIEKRHSLHHVSINLQQAKWK